ncbi:MAG: nucleotidyltransferase domain-containing protein [Nanoarchaeota archaeon]|nr:nucleotidyltransferase domain-containing protein [Nanoarchaeota archaeon]
MKKNKINKIKKPIVDILKKHKIRKAGIFGSYARGEENKNSDIDILIMPTEGMGLEFVEIALELEKKLGKKIDLVSYRGINPHLKEYILKDEVKII